MHHPLFAPAPDFPARMMRPSAGTMKLQGSTPWLIAASNRSGHPVGSPEHTLDLKARAERRFSVIDNLPEETRLLVHEYGWACVQALMNLGEKRPHELRRIIDLCRGHKP